MDAREALESVLRALPNGSTVGICTSSSGILSIEATCPGGRWALDTLERVVYASFSKVTKWRRHQDLLFFADVARLEVFLPHQLETPLFTATVKTRTSSKDPSVASSILVIEQETEQTLSVKQAKRILEQEDLVNLRFQWKVARLEVEAIARCTFACSRLLQLWGSKIQVLGDTMSGTEKGEEMLWKGLLPWELKTVYQGNVVQDSQGSSRSEVKLFQCSTSELQQDLIIVLPCIQRIPLRTAGGVPKERVGVLLEVLNGAQWDAIYMSLGPEGEGLEWHILCEAPLVLVAPSTYPDTGRGNLVIALVSCFASFEKVPISKAMHQSLGEMRDACSGSEKAHLIQEFAKQVSGILRQTGSSEPLLLANGRQVNIEDGCNLELKLREYAQNRTATII